MACLGHSGYQLLNIGGELLVVAPFHHDSLKMKSKHDLGLIIGQYLDQAEEGDIYIDHMINRSILENDKNSDN